MMPFWPLESFGGGGSPPGKLAARERKSCTFLIPETLACERHVLYAEDNGLGT